MYKKESRTLHAPTLEELREVLSIGLNSRFKEVSVEVVDCPNLQELPYGLSAKGIGGHPTIADVGAISYLLPTPNKDKIYTMDEVKEAVELNPCFMIGAGAGPWQVLNCNCEMFADIYMDRDEVSNLTKIGTVSKENKMQVFDLPAGKRDFSIMANLYCSEGKLSKVLQIKCKQRKGEDNFVTSIRKALKEKYKEEPIGLGGTFLLKKGKAKEFAMPDFSEKPLLGEDDFNKWATYHEFPAPFVTVGTLISTEIPEIDARLQHFHSFNHESLLGHYLFDLTPDEVEYEGVFNVAERIVRIDKPANSVQLSV